MVSRTHPEPHGLVVRFDRNGHPPETRHVTDGQQALLVGVAMLVEKRHLLVGDRLSVFAGDIDEEDMVL
jgi:hypothetical protein